MAAVCLSPAGRRAMAAVNPAGLAFRLPGVARLG